MQHLSLWNTCVSGHIFKSCFIYFHFHVCTHIQRKEVTRTKHIFLVNFIFKNLKAAFVNGLKYFRAQRTPPCKEGTTINDEILCA